MKSVLAAAIFVFCLTPSYGADLTIGMGSTITSIDPHFYNASPNNSIAMQIFDRLTERSAAGKLEPGLAVEWKVVDEKTWQFNLRPGVKWHDGKAFTSDDVLFTLQRAGDVPGSPGGFGGFLRTIEKVEASGPQTVIVHTKLPAPSLPGDLANIAIISRHAGEGATTADYNSGKAAIGTGAFKLSSFQQGDRVVLERNPDWWGKKVEWDKVTYRMIPNAGGRTAALLSGDVDIIDSTPATDIPRLERADNVSVVSVPGLRVIFLYPSFLQKIEPAFLKGPGGEELPKNPLLNVKVRQALSTAINREGIVERIMTNTATATGQWLPPGTYSYSEKFKVVAADPTKAKALLAEGGYPNGFQLTLHVQNDRYPNAPEVAQAVAQMWTRIGVKTSVESIPSSSYTARRTEYAMGFNSLGNATFDASSLLVNILGTKDAAKGLGASNDNGYSNPQLDMATQDAMSTTDDHERELKLVAAVKIALDDAAIIPLYQQKNTWAIKKTLQYTPRIDERTLAKDVTTK